MHPTDDTSADYVNTRAPLRSAHKEVFEDKAAIAYTKRGATFSTGQSLVGCGGLCFDARPCIRHPRADTRTPSRRARVTRQGSRSSDSVVANGRSGQYQLRGRKKARGSGGSCSSEVMLKHRRHPPPFWDSTTLASGPPMGSVKHSSPNGEPIVQKCICPGGKVPFYCRCTVARRIRTGICLNPAAKQASPTEGRQSFQGVSKGRPTSLFIATEHDV